MIAMGLTAIMVIGLMIFACQTKWKWFDLVIERHQLVHTSQAPNVVSLLAQRFFLLGYFEPLNKFLLQNTLINDWMMK